MNINELVNNLTNEETVDLDVKSLSLIKYSKEPNIADISELGLSDNAKSFPWMLDEDGKLIDYNKSVKLFDGVKLISQYLEKKNTC